MGSVTMQNIRDEVYKILDEYSTTTASVDTNITNRIDNQINIAYYELSEKNKLASSIYISQFPVENMLGETFSYDVHTTTVVNYTQASAYAYYFQTDNECTVDVKEASSNGTYTTLSTISITGISTFTEYKDFVTATVSSDYIRLSFYGDNVYTIRNVAFYPYTFNNLTASIPTFKPYNEYALPSDYDDINRVRYRYNADYDNFTDYRIEASSVLIPRGYSAEFIIDYWRFPSAVTTATNTFDILDKFAWLIPYHVAGTILVGNGFNVGAGQTLLNIYEQKKGRIDTSIEYGRQSVINYKGW